MRNSRSGDTGFEVFLFLAGRLGKGGVAATTPRKPYKGVNE